ncbi:hypothetical protein [Actinoplanes sp. NPDC026670]|uniref:hypothetical protein n=1 Tax=Actinoplanes sp. NPDC026670 TaxID=3154700 RepID=UPI0033C2422D
MKIITRARLTGLAGAATAVVLAATSFPAPAYAAETPATLAEKAAALRALGLEPTAVRTGYKDCDLTIEIWNALAGQQFRGEVRTAAVTAYTDPASLAGDASKCTLFLRTDVFAAKQRDVAIQIAAEEQDRIERELKQKAALTIGLPISTDDLGLTLKNFVDLIRKSDKAGTRVKAGAQTAYDASATEQMTFLGDGIVTAHEADREEQIRIEAGENEALRLRLIEEAARKRALAVLLVAATDGMLAASDRDFITYIWENAAQGTEVRGAAERAVLSREPADWNNYIHTGIHEARETDRQIALRKKYEADVAKADAVLAEATAAGQHILAVAARKALAGNATELDQFLRVGQFDLDLVTGFETGEVPLNWNHTPAWSDAIQGVNACPIAETQSHATKVTAATAAVASATAAVRSAEAALAAIPASNAAARAAAAAKVAAAKAKLATANANKANAVAAQTACAAKKPENSVVNNERAHAGSSAIRYYGVDQNTSRSHAYFNAINLTRITVKPTTKLTYWVYPESNSWINHVVAANSTCVAVDLLFSNGSTLRDSGAVDQNGNRAHAAFQCGKLTPETWNKVEVNLGSHFNGQAITTLRIAYDQPGNTGAYRGYFDDISIAD